MAARRTSRRSPYSSRSRRGTRHRWLIAAGIGVPVLVIAYSLTATVRAERATDTAAVSGIRAPGPQDQARAAGGWGRGGYMMMPGPAGRSGSAGFSRAESDSAPATATTSENWAGYASAGTPGTFTRVSASWAEPTVSCPANATFSSFWVGLDGDGTDSVEQTGTEADCASGAATYQGWFEMFPKAPVFYDNPVHAGDAMSASVVAGGGGSFTLTLTDATRGWTQITHQTSATARLGSAEIIAEAPSDGQVLPLSDFGTVNFTAALVDNRAIGDLNTTAITMESSAQEAEATPSALTDEDAFTVTFDNAGTGGHRHRHHHGHGG